MGQWFDALTQNLSIKCVAFAQLVKDADNKWGHKAPPQEVLENKIKSRDRARKRGDTVKWIKDYQKADGERER